MALFVRRRWPKVLAAVGVLAALVLGGWLLLRDDPAPTGDLAVLESASPVPEPTLPGVTVDVLAGSADPTSYVGHGVHAEDARVLSVAGPSAVWVGASESDRVLVVIASTEQTFDGVSAGTTLTFDGEVRPSTAEFGRAVGLTGADARAFAEQAAYVEITAYTTG